MSHFLIIDPNNGFLQYKNDNTDANKINKQKSTNPRINAI